MKTLRQIANIHLISKDTLRHRAINYGILGRKCGNLFMYSDEEENRLIISPTRGIRKSDIRLNHDLILSFRLMNPTLVAEEVAYALSVNLEAVKIAFKKEYLTLPSKMNRE